MADIAAVAVKPEDYGAAGPGDPPAVQADAIGGGEPDVVIIQVDIPWGADKVRIGEEDDAFFGGWGNHVFSSES